MLIDIALWATIGALLSVIGFQWDTWQFWCLIGTYWAVNTLSKQYGKIEGIIDYLEMTNADQELIKKTLEQAKEGTE